MLSSISGCRILIDDDFDVLLLGSSVQEAYTPGQAFCRDSRLACGRQGCARSAYIHHTHPRVLPREWSRDATCVATEDTVVTASTRVIPGTVVIEPTKVTLDTSGLVLHSRPCSSRGQDKSQSQGQAK